MIDVPELDHDALMLQRYGIEVSPTGRLERRIVANLITHLAADGFTLVGVDVNGCAKRRIGKSITQAKTLADCSKALTAGFIMIWASERGALCAMNALQSWVCEIARQLDALTPRGARRPG